MPHAPLFEYQGEDYAGGAIASRSALSPPSSRPPSFAAASVALAPAPVRFPRRPLARAAPSPDDLADQGRRLRLRASARIVDRIPRLTVRSSRIPTNR